MDLPEMGVLAYDNLATSELARLARTRAEDMVLAGATESPDPTIGR